MSLDPRIHALQTRPEATPAQAGFSLAAFASVFVPWYLGNFLLFHYRAGASEWLSAAAVPAAFSLAHVFVLHNLFWCGCMLWVRHRTHALTHLTDFMFQRHKWYWFQDPKRDPSFKRKFVEGGLYLLQFLAFILTPTLLSVHLPWMLHLSLLSPSEGREEMRLIDSSLGRPLPERSYGEGCDQWDQVYETFNDFFVFVHFVGFLLMSLAMRSFTIPFLISIWDEVLEFSLEHIFPNFKECWWDHALADLFGANLFGCLIGFCLLRACGVEPVSWLAPSSRFGDNDCNNQDDNENDLNRHSLLPRSLGLRLKQFLFGRDKTAFIFVSLIFVHRTSMLRFSASLFSLSPNSFPSFHKPKSYSYCHLRSSM
ncbi:Phosphatidylserine synthase 2, variant 2 [Balamuthia mandrillaris]